MADLIAANLRAMAAILQETEVAELMKNDGNLNPLFKKYPQESIPLIRSIDWTNRTTNCMPRFVRGGTLWRTALTMTSTGKTVN